MIPDELGLVWKYNGMLASWWSGITMLWVAGVLTVLTGWDYFRKGMPYIREKERVAAEAKAESES